MGSLKDFLNKLFNRQAVAYKVPFLHEPFEFDTKSERFILWRGEEAHSALSQIIIQSTQNSGVNKQLQNTDFYKSGKMAGISIQCPKHKFLKNDYLNLMISVVEKLVKCGYILSLSEIKSREKNANVEQSIKAYLKPSRKMVRDNKAEQLYGNVTLELLTINEILTRLNISCSYYQDQHFHPALDFSEFIEQNFNHE